MGLTYYQYSLAKGLKRVRTRTALVLTAISLAVSGGSGLSLALMGTAHAVTPNWNVNGTYVFDFEYQGGHYLHDANISGQDGAGNFNVIGGNPAGGAHVYEWSGTGTVSGNALTFSVDYSLGAVGTHMDMTGSVASNGTLSGSWTDDFGGTRSGTWASANGTASHVASQVVVTPTDANGWTTSPPLADNRPGSTVSFVNDVNAPGNPHIGALQLTTDATTAAKAQYMHPANTPLGDVLELSYATKQNSASFAGGDASYQLPVCLGGVSGTTCNGFTTLVYEPYENGTVTPGVWQSWDVDAGQMWSSRNYSNGTCVTVAGFGGAPFYTLAALKAACPDAVVVGFGINVGTFNPSYNVETDLFNFNGTTYNFEPYTVVTDKDQCKNDGWKTAKDANGNSFKNQGACVSFVASNGKSLH